MLSRWPCNENTDTQKSKAQPLFLQILHTLIKTRVPQMCLSVCVLFSAHVHYPPVQACLEMCMHVMPAENIWQQYLHFLIKKQKLKVGFKVVFKWISLVNWWIYASTQTTSACSVHKLRCKNDNVITEVKVCMTCSPQQQHQLCPSISSSHRTLSKPKCICSCSPSLILFPWPGSSSWQNGLSRLAVCTEGQTWWSLFGGCWVGLRFLLY